MENIKRYEVKLDKQTNEYTLYLYLEEQLTEFGSELGTTPKSKRNLVMTARQIIKERYPNMKVNMVKIMVGGMAVTSLALGTNISNAEAADLPETAQLSEESTIYYTVEAGDTLYSIAKKYNTSVDQIQRANDLTTDTLKVNQKLVIPRAFHMVASGDYLTVLAKRYETSIAAIKEANGLTSDATKVGQTLVIPLEISKEVNPLTSQRTLQSDTYIVVTGDTLWSLSKQFGTSVDAIKRANNLTTESLSIGQSIIIPTGQTEQQTKEETANQESQSYKVVAGDTLYSLASKFGTSVDAIKSANRLTTNTLSIGQTLIIPSGKVPESKPVPTPIQQNTSQNYRVVVGDTLWGIANKFDISVDAIKRANNLTMDSLSIGQILTIPSDVDQKATENIMEQSIRTHTVVPGETLWSISQRYSISVSAIKTVNNLKSDALQIGQTLTIPRAQGGVTEKTPSANHEQNERKTFVYTVKSGDSLSAIATRFSVSVEDIRTANNLKTDVLQVGQTLEIRDGLNAPDPTKENSVTYKTHTIQSGDNIWDLSVRYGIPQSELLRANNLTANSMLSIGQQLRIPVHHIAVKEVINEKYGEYMGWWTEAQYVFTIGKTAKVTDLLTGKSFNIKRTVGANHADSETVSINDTNIAKSIWGGFSWTPRAVILEVDGRKIAASMSFMPHEREYIANNGITGHFDVYFGNSTRHKDGKADTSHQLQVEKAAGLR